MDGSLYPFVDLSFQVSHEPAQVAESVDGTFTVKTSSAPRQIEHAPLAPPVHGASS
jgi:hypothetical protein